MSESLKAQRTLKTLKIPLRSVCFCVLCAFSDSDREQSESLKTLRTLKTLKEEGNAEVYVYACIHIYAYALI